MTPEHALDRTARLIRMDLFAREVSISQIIDGLQGTTVLIRADQANLSSPNGQTALCTLFSQIAMMGIGINLDIPDVPLLIAQPPLKGTRLRTALLDYATDLIPGSRCGTGLRNTDLSFALGDTATDDLHVIRVTGGDWSCAIGPARQTPPRRWQGTWPVGAMLAAAAAAPDALRIAVMRIASASGREPTREFRISPGLPVRIDLSSRAIPWGASTLGASTSSAAAPSPTRPFTRCCGSQDCPACCVSSNQRTWTSRTSTATRSRDTQTWSKRRYPFLRDTPETACRSPASRVVSMTRGQTCWAASRRGY